MKPKFATICACLIILGAIELASKQFSAAQESIRLPSFSEEQKVSTCPSGFVIKGIECDSSYCDNKQLQCIRYTQNFDASANYRWSYWFSEEPPRRDFSRKEFASGLSCAGAYCDNIRIQFLNSGKILNSGQCLWVGPFSEEQGYRECPANYYLSGIGCSGAYCDNLSLYCCRVKFGN